MPLYIVWESQNLLECTYGFLSKVWGDRWSGCTLLTVMTTRAPEVLITTMLKAHITCKSTTENVGSNGFIITRTNFVTLRYRTDRLDASS